ncbi:MAG: SCO family protein [Deltaproteobacteria bacterium]|nr:SCO family protein [Deltaproteobacteria bacterium]
MAPRRAIALCALLLVIAPPGARAAELPVMWPVPAFDFTDQDGHRFTDHELRGKVWIGDYIYTTCTSACPILTAHLRMLQRKLDGHAVSFVSFSVDPAHDTPAALKAYAARWHGDESRWRLLATKNAGALHAFATGMQTEVTASASPDDPVMHSERFVLIDAKGQVRGRYDSTSPEELAQLAVDAAALADAQHAPRSAVDASKSGRELADSLGCMACHASSKIAPPLEGLAGSMVELHDEAPAVADAVYLRESILDPSAKVVSGYLATMPSYKDHLTDAQVDALVAWLTSLGHAPKPPTDARTVAVDPVCHMKLSAGADTPHATVDGHAYHFCSETCRQAFLRDPARYARATDGGIPTR